MTVRDPVVSGLCLAVGGGAGLLLVGGWPGAAIGVVAGAACAWWLGRQPSAAERDERERIRGDLPFAADLLAAALRAGAAPDAAARLVAGALGGPLGRRLTLVDRSLRLGGGAGEAWAYLGDSHGSRRIADAADRTTHSGAAFAGSLLRVADDLRLERLVATEAAARRAGVLIVLPLGLCFLPAFVLIGLVPVIAAVVGGVLLP